MDGYKNKWFDLVMKGYVINEYKKRCKNLHKYGRMNYQWTVKSGEKKFGEERAWSDLETLWHISLYSGLSVDL